jgi:hypothetical protein
VRTGDKSGDSGENRAFNDGPLPSFSQNTMKICNISKQLMQRNTKLSLLCTWLDEHSLK